MIQPTNIKKDFPIFKEYEGKKPLIYLDSTATSQKPKAVIEAITEWYKKYNANIHRGVYELSETATEKYEQSRQKVADFIKARSAQEIIFTRGTTEGINLVAEAWGRKNLQAGDKVLTTTMEHHANLVPWHKLMQEKGIELNFIEFNEQGELIIEELEEKLKGVKLVSLVHVSNVLGTINPVKDIIRAAHQHNIPVLLDAAQSVPHLPVDVQELDVDWLAFSGHKMLGPTGIGALYVKEERFGEMDIYQGGGDMIKKVELDNSEYKNKAGKYEAGTQNMAGAYGLAAAIDYLQAIGMDKVAKHDEQLVKYAYDKLSEIKEVKIFGPAGDKRTGCVSFVVDGIHAHDVASLLDEYGICIRVGHHCAMPLHKKLNVPATARASFYVYNDKSDVDALVEAMQKIIKEWKEML